MLKGDDHNRVWSALYYGRGMLLQIFKRHFHVFCSILFFKQNTDSPGSFKCEKDDILSKQSNLFLTKPAKSFAPYKQFNKKLSLCFVSF